MDKREKTKESKSLGTSCLAAELNTRQALAGWEAGGGVWGVECGCGLSSGITDRN